MSIRIVRVVFTALTAVLLTACVSQTADTSVLRWKNIRKDAKKYVESIDDDSQDPCSREVTEWYYQGDGNRIEILVDCKNDEDELLKLVVDRKLKRVVAVVYMGGR